jgi:hypothetical protein
MLNASRPYLIRGRVEEDSGSININVERVDFLDRNKGQNQSPGAEKHKQFFSPCVTGEGCNPE